MDITTYALLKKKIDQLGISDSKIEEVIENFLLAHPEYIGATDQQAAQIIANTAAIQGLEADEIKIVTLNEYNALTEEQKKEKKYLIWDESTNNILIDNILDENSTNPVQNKVITKEITELKKSVSDALAGGITDDQIKQIVEQHFEENPVQVITDNTLSVAGIPADSLATGTAIDLLKGDLVDLIGKTVISEKNRASITLHNFPVEIKKGDIFEISISTITKAKLISVCFCNNGERLQYVYKNYVPDQNELVIYTKIVSDVNASEIAVYFEGTNADINVKRFRNSDSIIGEQLNNQSKVLEGLNELVIFNNLIWNQGVIQGNGVIDPQIVTRICTPIYLPVGYFINRCININSDYEYAVCCTDKDGNVKTTGGHYGYLDINRKTLSTVARWYNTSINLYDYKYIMKDYSYIRFIIRKKGVPIDDTSNPITPFFGSMLTITDDWGKILNSLTYDDGLKIVNEINKNSRLWTQWNNRLAFGMNPTEARVPYNIDGQLYVNGTVIARNTASQKNNRWGFHVYEAYANDNYSRMTMLLDKHNHEFDNKPTLEYYYYTGADHHEKSYGYTKIGSDVLYKSFLFSRDKMIAGGVIDCRFVLTLANISKTNDFNTTYETVEEADNAYEPENEAAENVRCMKYIYYKNATNGSLYYDKDTNHVMAKINNVWQELSYHAVGDIVMSSLSLVDFEIVHYGKWKLIKTESFNDPTGESQTINYYKRIK